MKKLLNFCLMLVLSISVMAMSACFGGGTEKTEFQKMFDVVSENCTIRATGAYSEYYIYKYTEDKIQVVEPTSGGALGTKWWDATDTSDYVLLERSADTLFNLRVTHKDKWHYTSARKDTFSLLFGCFAEHEDEFTKTPEGNYKSTLGDPIVHTHDGAEYQYDDITIFVEEGKIVSAEYTIFISGTPMGYELQAGNTTITLPEYSRE